MPWKEILDHTGALPVSSSRFAPVGQEKIIISVDGDTSVTLTLMAVVEVAPGETLIVPLRRKDENQEGYQPFIFSTTMACEVRMKNIPFAQVDVTGVSSGQINIWAWEAPN